MSSKNHRQETRGTPSYVQKIRLNNNACKIKKGKPPKICPDCKETNDSVKIFSRKVDKIEEAIGNLYKQSLKKNKNRQLSIFNAKFKLNNIPCELEYDLSNFSLENLHKLAISITTQHCNNNDKHPSSISSNDNKSDAN
ncbi:hypothetical protein RclHR1_10290003 [Rhizophagus clarus]|uniref:Uncharacterized protein n=1 Tax=Rhizophagus clarus TaxID=94130 RepID=A0A2Z6QFN6_9GLOM|nr:hypothetical protein RclHR1_10290003 [Rhizophagus clarus]GES95392.1 hypothetical protein GLOIN_2v1868012 [Rhizophagus clarus]